MHSSVSSSATSLPQHAFLLDVCVKVAAKDLENPELSVKAVGVFHDRFLILDDKELYHFGASLKDLGRQYCAVTKMDAVFIPSVLKRI